MSETIDVLNGEQLKAPRILFIGGTPRGLQLFEYLRESGENIVGAYLMKEDDHEDIKVSDRLAEACEQNKIPYKVCKRINVDELESIQSFKPDICFVCGWRTLISHEIYKKIPYGCYAAHDSLLPKYRGFAPINWAIINGEKITGVTLFKIEDGPADSGPIFSQREVSIGDSETAPEVYVRICDATVDLYKELLAALKKGRVTLQVQDESLATYTTKRTPEDGKIDWSQSAKDVFNLVRALSPPYPCAWTFLEEKKIYISKASISREPLTYDGNIPGRIISVLDDGVVVLCGDGQIVVNELIDEEGNRVSANKILASVKITLG